MVFIAVQSLLMQAWSSLLRLLCLSSMLSTELAGNCTVGSLQHVLQDLNKLLNDQPLDAVVHLLQVRCCDCAEASRRRLGSWSLDCVLASSRTWSLSQYVQHGLLIQLRELCIQQMRSKAVQARQIHT